MSVKRAGWALLAAAILAAGVAATATAADAARPNILWLTYEDAGPELGCFGVAAAQTPRMDGFAAEGVRFTRAYANAAVCAPARATLITGMYAPSFAAHPMRTRVALQPPVAPFTAWLREAGYFCTNNNKTDYQFEPPAGAWDENSEQAHWRNRPTPETPFFAVFNFHESHESGIQRQYERRMKDPAAKIVDAAAVELPPYYPDTPTTREAWAAYLDTLALVDRHVGEMLDQLEADGLADNTVVFIFGDHGAGLPRSKRESSRSGHRVGLLARGPGVLGAGSVSERLVSFVDLGPTMLSLAGMEVPAHMQGTPFLGEREGAAREFVWGFEDRRDERSDTSRSVFGPRFHYIRNYEPWKPYYQKIGYRDTKVMMKEILRLRERGELTGYPAERWATATKPAEEFYDMQADPHEIRNLAGDPEFAGEIERLRAIEARQMIETGDLGLVPEALLSDWVEHPRPAEAFGRLREVKLLAGRGSEAAAELLAAAGDGEAAIRAIAFEGLGAVGAAEKTATESLGTGLADPEAIVRVYAAEALVRLGSTSEAPPPAIGQGLTDANGLVRLRAAQTLELLGERARPLLETIRAEAGRERNAPPVKGEGWALERKNDYVGRLLKESLAELEK